MTKRISEHEKVLNVDLDITSALRSVDDGVNAYIYLRGNPNDDSLYVTISGSPELLGSMLRVAGIKSDVIRQAIKIAENDITEWELRSGILNPKKRNWFKRIFKNKKDE